MLLPNIVVLVYFLLSCKAMLLKSTFGCRKIKKTKHFLSSLSFDLNKSNSVVPDKSVLFLHGILGSKKNWRTPSIEFVKLHSNFQTITIDHRGHGSSPIYPETSNTVSSCAHDIIQLLDTLQFIPPVELVCAHSFSGKVSLVMLQHLIAANKRLPRHTWVLDAVPGLYNVEVDSQHQQSVSNIISLLARLPEEFESKDWMSKHLVSLGIPLSVALWLCMNVIPVGAHSKRFRFSFHMETIVQLFEDYCALDLWDFLSDFERLTAQKDGNAHIHFIRAGKNNMWTPDVLDMFDVLTKDSDKSRIHLHTMPHVGHWLHSDDLPGTLSIISKNSGLS